MPEIERRRGSHSSEFDGAPKSLARQFRTLRIPSTPTMARYADNVDGDEFPSLCVHFKQSANQRRCNKNPAYEMHSATSRQGQGSVRGPICLEIGHTPVANWIILPWSMRRTLCLRLRRLSANSSTERPTTRNIWLFAVNTRNVTHLLTSVPG